MGHLFLNTIDGRFDPAEDRVIGPWCLIGTDYIDGDWAPFEFFEPFSDADEEARAAAGCAELVRYHMGRLATAMNERHGLERRFPFWWTLLAAWLQHLVEASWRQWRHAEEFAARHGSENLAFDLPAVPESFSWNFADTRDFIYRGLRSPDFIAWMMARFLVRIGPENWTPVNVPAPDSGIANTANVEPPVSTNFLKRSVRKIFRRLPATNLPGISGASLLLSAYVAALPRRSSDSDFRITPADAPPEGFPAAYLDCLEDLIVRTLPRSFGADFARYDGAASGLRYRPKRLFVTAPTIFEDSRSFEIAHAIEAGERVVRVQHGSEYGTARVFNIGWMNEFVNAAFLTWGWTSQAGFPGRFVPVSAPALSGLRDRHRARTPDIVLIGTAASLVPFRIASALKPSAMADYIADKARFVRELRPDLFRDVLYRPYRRGQMELSDLDWLSGFDPAPRVHTGPLSPALLSCRLAVLDHPGTTLNVTLGANVPTVCFWPAETSAFCDEAAPLFDRLRAAGIVHDDPAAAAAHVNAIADDVAGWWQDAETQSARRAWADQYARTHKIWWWSWLTALAKI